MLGEDINNPQQISTSATGNFICRAYGMQINYLKETEYYRRERTKLKEFTKLRKRLFLVEDSEK